MTASVAMTSAAKMAVGQLFDANVVAGIMESRFSDQTSRPRHLRLERCWPGDASGPIFQWSFLLRRRRCSLYARPAVTHLPAKTSATAPGLDGDGQLRGMLFGAPQCNFVFHTADRDPRMRHLTRCLSPTSAAVEIRPLLHGTRSDANATAVGELTCRLLSYKPGRRALIGYEDTQARSAPARCCGKTHRKKGKTALPAIHRELNRQLEAISDGAVRVPAVLGYAPKLRMTVFSWADGEPVPHEPQSLDRAVDALAALHATQLEALPRFGPADEIGVLLRWHQLLSIGAPSATREFEQMISALCDLSGQAQPARTATIHRDYYEAQILCTSNDIITILDLDTIACGDPCLDLGNLIAHAYLRSLRDRHQHHNLVGFVKQVLDRYARARYAVDPLALRFYLGSSLLRLAMIHTLRSKTRRYARSLYKSCARILNTGPRGVNR